MLNVVYGLIAIISTTVGAMTGMGGGVIIKPVLDIFGHFNAATINQLSSLTVLIMSVVSVGRMIAAKTRIEFRKAVPLALGGLVGGNVGKAALSAVLVATGAGKQTLVVQNIVLALLIIPIIYLMRHKETMPRLNWRGMGAAFVVGLFLGIFSAFLGIGGGPFNVVGIMIVLGIDTKMAALYSLFIILFSQAAAATTTWLTTGFAMYNLAMLPVMAVGAVAGGLIGAHLHKRFSTGKVETMFNIVQIVVLLLCLVNIIRNW